jgi:AcrR family transcriptional regulator
MSDETLSKGEQTRKQIVETAYALFIAQGYHATSMRQIAKEAGIGLGSAYNHFATKEDIFAAVFEEYHPYNEVLPLMEESGGENVEEFIRNFATRMIDALNTRPNFINLLFVEIVEFDGKHMVSIFSRVVPRGLGLLQKNKTNILDAVHPVPPLMLIRTMVGMVLSYYMTEKALPPNPSLPAEFHTNAQEYFLEIYLHGILKGGQP